jgi:TPR repeat protein
MYGNGHGMPVDYAKALQWYTAASEQGIRMPG